MQYKSLLKCYFTSWVFTHTLYIFLDHIDTNRGLDREVLDTDVLRDLQNDQEIDRKEKGRVHEMWGVLNHRDDRSVITKGLKSWYSLHFVFHFNCLKIEKIRSLVTLQESKFRGFFNPILWAFENHCFWSLFFGVPLRRFSWIGII